MCCIDLPRIEGLLHSVLHALHGLGEVVVQLAVQVSSAKCRQSVIVDKHRLSFDPLNAELFKQEIQHSKSQTMQNGESTINERQTLYKIEVMQIYTYVLYRHTHIKM